MLTSSLVLCRDIEDAVGVNVKDDIDLWHSSGCRWNAAELKLAQQVVVLGARSLALKDLDEHTGLVVGVGGEDLLLLGGDGCVSGDQGGLQCKLALRISLRFCATQEAPSVTTISKQDMMLSLL